MDVSGITPEIAFAMKTALTGSAFGMGVEKKVIEQAQTDGANLARLIDSAGGLGGTINTQA